MGSTVQTGTFTSPWRTIAGLVLSKGEVSVGAGLSVPHHTQMTSSELLFPSLTTMFKAILGSRIDQKAVDFLDLFADNGSMEFPFALEGRPKRVQGRSALKEYLTALNGRWEVDSYSKPIVHWTQDPNVVIVEFSVKAHMRDSGLPHDQVYIDVLTLQDGKIRNFRDYWNPTLTQGYSSESDHEKP